MADEYWLVSVPGNPSKDAAYKQLEAKVGPASGLTTATAPFNVPNDLKVGTLDSLVALSDDLIRLDPLVEQVVKKIAALLQELLQDHPDKLAESLSAEGQNVHEYIRRFQWDVRKYSVKNSTRELVDDIVSKVTAIETELKTRQNAYTQIKNSLAAIERSETGSLLARSLVGIVERKHVVDGSEYLQTIFVCVPKNASKDFQDSYERLTDMVVPRSGIKIAEDADFELWGVTVLKRVIDEFKHAAREKKFIVRDFTYDPKATEHSATERKEMEVELKKQWSAIVRWGKTYFSETFTSWMHIKAIRIFVESVLRYGLPPNFQAAAMCPNTKKEKQLRQVMQEMYAHLEKRGGPRSEDKKGADFEVPAGMGAGLNDYYAHVYFSFNLAFLSDKKK
eukprot:comp25884_c0_seq1/m.47043 comp25884_c0_seq1/g.47043  ORF comp25884_c0_seq1/g.47043 comp25884_c0_seq1/m.47043 type:complete len:393 (-) comp25884_c0_seq1:498-1676(-)